MRILYVVQRYGEEIVGGSEAACRQFAEHLVEAGHQVTILTSCAKSYVTWENHYQPGESMLNGVNIVRLPVIGPRLPEYFGPQDQWLMSGKGRPGSWEHERWAHLMGPDVRGMRTWMIDNAASFDVAIFMTYLYTTTTMGIPVLAGRLPVIFQPTAHMEPPLKVPIFDATFRLPDAYLFFTPEERQVVEDRFGFTPKGKVVGIGIDQTPETDSSEKFRDVFGLESNPYLVYVGRLDPMKGVVEMCNYFAAMKKRHPSALKLVLAGEAVIDLPQHDDILVTGFLDEATKQAAIAGSVALIQSSYFESFSIVLCESWVQSRPALVQGASPVLRGQALRSGGAIPYEGFAEFEQAVLMLLENEELSSELGRSGRRYVESTYNWPHVIEELESVVALAQERFRARTPKLRASD